MVYLLKALCQVTTVLIAYAPIKVSVLPKGECWKCCPIDEEKDIKFLLYTRTSPRDYTQLYINRVLPAGSTLNTSWPTVIYLHGFSEVAPGQSGEAIKDAYLSTGDYNIILVDWGPLIALPWYISAVRNTMLMGEVLSRFVQWLEGVGVKANTLHIVGFSLGAEAAGLAGKRLSKNGLTIKRITGLDPAFPLYNLAGRRGRLSSGDAAFVDVIHTNSGVFGYPTPIGDVDFYPNWDSYIQPGCSPVDMLRKGVIDQIIGCSHRRAWQLYVETILNPKGFIAKNCKSLICRSPVAYMGIAASPRLRGSFYLKTSPKKIY